ncbi:DUF748 domain-containing protein [Sulfuriferula nivalis]|uniref:Flagellar motor protein MotB n=1 Tax=Sulfuriferula nivalis TaxID=2675298 RepID=A0A809SBE5_9PROT|nr:DUF748 domain-containing protein [Sulfuriferula nivalis]BBP02242.1 flagellar motor protein MotB [Sulfuriferula nivalis]
MNLPAFITSPRSIKWSRRLVIATLILWAIGFFIMPYATKPLLEKLITDKYHRPVSIDSISINPIVLSARIKQFNMLDRDGKSPLLKFKELYVNVQARSIFAGAPVVEALQLTQPELHISRLTANTYNITDIIDDILKPSDSKTLFSLNNIQVTQGLINFDDQPVHTQQVVSDLNLNIPFISNLPYQAESYVTPLLMAKINGAAIKLTGRSQPFATSHQSMIDLKLTDVDIAKYMGYVPAKLNFSVSSAHLDTNLVINFAENTQHQPTLNLSGTASLSQIQMAQANNSLLAIKQLSVKLDNADLFGMHFKLSQLNIDSPDINLTRNTHGQLNFSQLLPSSPAEKSAPAAKSNPVLLEIADVNLTHGSVNFNDEVPSPVFHTRLNDIDIHLKQFSTAANHPMNILASLTTDYHATLSNTTKLTLNPLAAEGDLQLTDIALEHYAPYYNKLILFNPAGTANLASHYQFSLTDNTPQLRLSQLNGDISQLQFQQHSNNLLKIAHLAVKQGELDLAKHSVTLGEISTEDGLIEVKRNRGGVINFTQLTPDHPTHAHASTTSPDWTVAVSQFALSNYAVNFTDASAASPVTVKTSNIKLSASDFSTVANNKTKLDLQLNINRTGKLVVNGLITPTPFSGTLNLTARGIDIVPIQPYFADQLNVTVTDGDVSAKGKLQLATHDKQPTTINYTGNANITSFASVDNQDSADFLKWDNLALQHINFASQPQRLSINTISLAGLYSRLIINPDGKLNVQNIVKTSATPTTTSVAPAAAVPAPQPAKQPAVVSINKIALNKGHVNFTDHYIKPNYSANLTDLNGGVTGLSSLASSKADILINGKVDNQGQLDISGQVNPLSGNLYLNLLAKLSDFELSPLTPYSAKYAGYGIQKGKLGFEVKYQINDRKLSAENHLYLNQLTLGDKIDSPTATKLPVTLALALLKDRNGNIDINLPISGSLDDPQFSIGGLIIKVIVNLLVKAVTSPFALIGGLLGGDSAQLSFLDFPAGSAIINEAGITKLDHLSKALADRPSLKLDIAGRVDTETDSNGLRQLAFERLLKVQKLKQLVKDGVSITSADDIKIASNEYTTYLKAAYKADKIPDKPKIMGLIDKDIPPAQMEKLMLANIKISADDLRDLTIKRAQAAKEYLLKSGAIDATRIFITTAKTESEEQKKLPDNRVDFILGSH